jgi:hypothetical protein
VARSGRDVLSTRADTIAGVVVSVAGGGAKLRLVGVVVSIGGSMTGVPQLNPRTIAVLVSSAWLVAAAAGTSADAQTSIATSTEQPRIVVTRDDGSLPRACSPLKVARQVSLFLNAANNAPTQMLSNFFGPGLAWFSVDVQQRPGTRYHFLAAVPEGVIEYLGRRQRVHEHQRLLTISVGYDERLKAAAFHLGIWVTADDLHPKRGVLFGGKAGIDCRTHRLVAWSVATPVIPLFRHLCPPPPTRQTARRIIACSRK